MSTRIGTVQILRDRIYSLDPENHALTATTVLVAPGTFDLYDDDGARFWLMRGRLNKRGTWRMGDGLFALYQWDEPSDVEVTFPSRRFGPDEWTEMLSTPSATEGADGQRIRVTIYEGDAPELQGPVAVQQPGRGAS
ncbi:MAG TPA: hypothetical protein VF174_09045 [Micromonosporaceae bacterium]